MNLYVNNDRFKENIKQMARLDKAMSVKIENSRVSTRLVIDSKGGLNIDLGKGALFYPDGARAAAAQQVAMYMADPTRYVVDIGPVYDDCIELNKTYAAMTDCVAEFPKLPKPGPFGGNLIVFGLGLGFHVLELIRRLRFKTLIIVEPHDDFIVHSMHVVDWKDLTRTLANSGRGIEFVRGAGWFARLTEIVRGDYYPLLSGSYFYFHFQAPEFQQVQKLVLEGRSNDWVAVAGWVEDQLTLLRNNYGNFHHSGFHIQKARVASPRALPAFVVGAGPSLDSDIEDIRRCRDEVVLISASSALKVLLEHGLTPDIHCELENGAGLATVSEQLAARHDLSGTVLYGASSIDPGIARYYRTAVYFFRQALSSTAFFGEGAEATRTGEPTSGNTALHCALSLGFREIYLFGLDFGARDAENHHSRHSVYYTYEDESEMATWSPYDFTRRHPGNFGGEVLTGWILDLGREAAAAAIRAASGVKVMNCSDGVLIAGAIPQAAEAIALAPSPVRQADEIGRVLAELPYCSEPPADSADFAALGEVFRGYVARVTDLVDGLDVAGPDPQMAVVGLCERVVSELRALDAAGRAGQAVRFTLLGHTQEALAAAFHAASFLAPSHAAEGLAAIRRTLSDSFQRLHPLLDAVFPPHSGGMS